ncbi:MAG TPA: hypothetical protein VMH88_08865 [Gemmatimonadales bacterium]|nr:hypothetical protein [Gemmatimonadales bacterium]
MGKIDLKGVLVGGLVAGVVLNVIDYLAYGVVFARDFPLPEGGTFFGIPLPAWFVVVDFLFGLVLVYLYAAIRPRFGPGPRTACIAGLLMWVIVGLLHALSEAPMGTTPGRVYALAVVIGFINFPLGALAGGRFYIEP